MYQIISLIIILNTCLLFVKFADCLNLNCSNYQQTNKENIRNCLSDIGQMNNNVNYYSSSANKSVSETKVINLNTEIERKMKMGSILQKYFPYLIVPGLIMSGLLPWILPAIKLVVMAVTMVNQMAFTTALMAVIRSYIFDTTKNDHIIYINQGYKKHKPHSFI